MDWASIIQKEYEFLKMQREKDTIKIWDENLASASGNQSDEARNVKLNKERDECLQINAGDTIKTILNEKDREVRNVVMLPTQTPLPKMAQWLPIPRNFVAQDFEDPERTPHLTNDACDGNDSGKKCEPIDNEMFVRLVHKMAPYQNRRNSMSSTQLIDGYQSVELDVEKVIPADVIFQSISSYFDGNYTAEKFMKLTKLNTSSPNLDEPLSEPIQPQQSLHAYRKYFCRRCCVYNCQLHPRATNIDGETALLRKDRFDELKPFTEPCSCTCYLTEKVGNNAPPLQCPSGNRNTTENIADCFDDIFIPDSTIDFQRSFAEVFPSDPNLAEMTLDTFNRIFVEYLPPAESANSSAQCQTSQPPLAETGATVANDLIGAADLESEWSSSDQSLFFVLLTVFPYNCCAIAKTMRKSCKQVHKKFESTDRPARNEFDRKSPPKKRSIFYGEVQKHLAKTYSPCHHQEPCNQTTKCLCVNCEKYCSCGLECTKRMPRCACKGACTTVKCICYYDQRECDPEMCGCRTCKNVGIQIGKVKKLQVVPSSIHSWGVVVAEACQKGDFIAEYKGEIISNKECERREKLYRKDQSTYMFTLNGDSVIDSMFFGSKVRFLNFSPEPNCYCRVMMVNGDHRIGVYAARNIADGEELTISYGTYDPTMVTKV